jgi:hypothetical protein
MCGRPVAHPNAITKLYTQSTSYNYLQILNILKYKNITLIQDLFQCAIYHYDFSIMLKDTKLFALQPFTMATYLTGARIVQLVQWPGCQLEFRRTVLQFLVRARDLTLLQKHPDQLCFPFRLLFNGYQELPTHSFRGHHMNRTTQPLLLNGIFRANVNFTHTELPTKTWHVSTTHF